MYLSKPFYKFSLLGKLGPLMELGNKPTHRKAQVKLIAWVFVRLLKDQGILFPPVLKYELRNLRIASRFQDIVNGFSLVFLLG